MAKVMLVDDDPIVREVAGDVLREAGHELRVVDSGAAMMQELLREPADVILLDVNMPGMSGDRLANVLAKGLEEPLPRVLLYSGLELNELRRLARKVGATGYVRKGGSKEGLLGAVAAAARVAPPITEVRLKTRPPQHTQAPKPISEIVVPDQPLKPKG